MPSNVDCPFNLSRVMVYKVASGDTLSKIAGWTLGNNDYWPIISEFNKMSDPNNIKVGQMIRIPVYTSGLVTLCVTTIMGPPLIDYVVSGYRYGYLYPPNVPYGGTAHPGIDMVSKYNYVVSAAPGVVYRTWRNVGGYGKYVMLSHRTLSGLTLYTLSAHLSSFIALEGERIRSKTINVGIMGSTGNSTGEHVHFEVKKSSGFPGQSNLTLENIVDYYLDPMKVINNVEYRFVDPGVAYVRNPTQDELDAS